MRNKITVRLILYFGISLLLFALLVGSIFIWSFSSYSTQLHRQDLEDRAARIAETMAGYLGDGQPDEATEDGEGHGGGKGKNAQNGMAGYGRYLGYLEDIAMADVWVIDSDGNILTRGESQTPITDKVLPVEAEEIVQKILDGETAFSESFSGVLGEANLTVGVPILEEDDSVLGAVLLHSPVHGLTEARDKQIQVILISIVLALVVTVPLTILLSYRFAKPLNRMKEVSQQMAEGDYSVKTQIKQKDEFGQLAGSIDILSDRLAEASREQQEMEKMRQTFFSNISHELRTPVTVMRGSLEALVDGVVSEPAKVRDYHAQMLKESIHLQRLVNDLLELSRLQNADFTIEMGDVNFCDVIRDVSRSMRQIAAKKNITISIDGLPAEMPMAGDYSRLRQMLMIVVDNAIKFSPPDETVSIKIRQADKYTAVSVIDHGQGIAPEDLPYIFDRFHRAMDEGNKQGTGLGLAIAKAIAQRHGLQMRVDSQKGKTIFSFEIEIDD